MDPPQVRRLRDVSPSRSFKLPTEFPEDDRLEHHLQASQSLYINLQHIWNAERQTDDTLAAVDLKMLQCQEKVREALKYYETCTWSSGSSSRTDVLTNLEPRKAGKYRIRSRFRYVIVI